MGKWKPYLVSGIVSLIATVIVTYPQPRDSIMGLFFLLFFPLYLVISFYGNSIVGFDVEKFIDNKQNFIIVFIFVYIQLLIYHFINKRVFQKSDEGNVALVVIYVFIFILMVSILVFDDEHGIKIFNDAAESIFHKSENDVIGKSLNDLVDESECKRILDSSASMEQIECTIGNVKKSLLVSKKLFKDENNIKNTILVIRDLTEQRKMEAQIQRNERLTAMGELASGVAHEIRNPLNAIGTIIQQLEKDFEPKENEEEYRQLSQLVYQEVRRINETIQDFLKFARPEPIRASSFKLSALLSFIQREYSAMLDEKNIELKIEQGWKGEVFWDYQQMQQVFMNLIQNSIDSLENEGSIEITIDQTQNNELEIRCSDTGPGIPENIRSKIFNLYFTTKAKGTGIGLSIVQRIIYEHGGLITLDPDSKTFVIRMPVNIV